MQRVKKIKKKKSILDIPTKTPREYIFQTNYVNLAIAVRSLKMVYDWSDEQIKEFCESYLILMNEIASHRTTVNQFIDDTIELTDIDVRKLLDDTMENINK